VKVLLVDDEMLIRLAARDVIEEAGDVVVEAANGNKALQVLSDDPSIGLLFTDIRMPGMTGLELAYQAEKLRPDLRIGISTGFSDIQIPARWPVLHKPWTASALTGFLDKLRA
jgi:YesN/AraC family two-component response regulator